MGLIPKNHKGKQFHKKFLKFHYGAKHSHIEGNDHSYVASAGTCNGDSGGPLFRSENGKNIVTGVVSGGRGTLAMCGGINNPVHYVRVSQFSTWIANILGNEAKNLCWDSGDSGHP